MGAWQLTEQRGALISQPWAPFPRGPEASVKLVMGKKLQYLPRPHAGLSPVALVGGSAISTGPFFPSLLSLVPGGLGICPRSSSGERRDTVAARYRAQPRLFGARSSRQATAGEGTGPCSHAYPAFPSPPFRIRMVSDDPGGQVCGMGEGSGADSSGFTGNWLVTSSMSLLLLSLGFHVCEC